MPTTNIQLLGHELLARGSWLPGFSCFVLSPGNSHILPVIIYRAAQGLNEATRHTLVHQNYVARRVRPDFEVVSLEGSVKTVSHKAWLFAPSVVRDAEFSCTIHLLKHGHNSLVPGIERNVGTRATKDRGVPV